MILTRTPLRISLAGGGTDLPEFWQEEPGAVVSFTIDRYLYITLNPKFDGRTRLSYSVTETVNDPSELKHDLARHTLAYYEAEGLEITSISDIPGKGSGLGSSSAYTVGLCRALSAWRNETLGPLELAERAYTIERTLTGHPVGKQDHYAAAVGGLTHYKIGGDVETIPLEWHIGDELENQLLFFWTGVARYARDILRAETERVPENLETLRKIKHLAIDLSDCLQHGQIDRLGPILHEGWMLKRTLGPGISEDWIDELYQRAMSAGATGGKLCGAGGGGFLIFAVPDEYKRSQVEQALGLRRIPFHIARGGSKVVYSD